MILYYFLFDFKDKIGAAEKSISNTLRRKVEKLWYLLMYAYGYVALFFTKEEMSFLVLLPHNSNYP